jgi:hypothetical protein
LIIGTGSGGWWSGLLCYSFAAVQGDNAAMRRQTQEEKRVTTFSNGKTGSLNASSLTKSGTTVSGSISMVVNNSNGTNYWTDTVNVPSTAVSGTESAPTTVQTKRTNANDSTMSWTLVAWPATAAREMAAGGGDGGGADPTDDGGIELKPVLTIGGQSLTVTVTLPGR